MHDTHPHGPPLVTAAAGFVALIADDAGRFLALMVGFGGLWISIVRLMWDWQDRKERRAAHRPPSPAPRPPRSGFTP